MRTYKILSLSVVILLIAVVFVGVVPAAAQYDTMQYRYNAQHSGDYSPVAGPVPSNGQLKWSYTTGSYVSASPAVANGVVYVGGDDNNVYALYANNGTKLWSFATGQGFYSSPAVANGIVYVGGWDGSLYALYANNGTKLWSFPMGSYVHSSPAVANGIVYVGSLDDNVYALYANNGTKLWSFPTNGVVESSPAVANGVVYVGSDDNNVYALYAGNGAVIWNYTTGGSVYSSPAVANGVVYVGSQDHNLYALGTTPTTLTATASATNVAVNQKFTVSGTLKTTNAPVTPVTGQPAYLEASNDGATWFRISANKNTASTGAYSFTGYISQSGTYYLRAHFDGTTTYAASVSTPPITVTVS